MLPSKTMDATVKQLLKFLPKYEEISHILQTEPEADYILQVAIADMQKSQAHNSASAGLDTEEGFYLVSALADKCWERIHTGHFSQVPVETRKIYALANYFKIFYLLLESMTPEQLERCSELLDEAILIGCTQALYGNSDALQEQLTRYFGTAMAAHTASALPIIQPLKRCSYPCDIPTLDCPSVEDFQRHCFEAAQPTLLLNTIEHWPAMTKWPDLNYLLNVAGNRTVPIEIGSNYTTDEWSQQLVKIRDFLQRQFAPKTASVETTKIEYLAQHELFDQIPALKADIRVPDYCSLRANACAEGSSVSIKAWLGPEGTVSPMHYDPEHNLLCQVFGRKHIILAAPADTPNLYPHESEMLCNTARIDAAHLDVAQFPRVTAAQFYSLTLQAGDCLYMPPKWWHYVRAESESFSVSFWWT